MKNKKLLTIISIVFILLIGGATFYAFNKAQDDRQEKMELAQKKIDKENKKKQDKILAEKKKLEEEKKKLEEEQKVKQDELDRLQAEKESIAPNNQHDIEESSDNVQSQDPQNQITPEAEKSNVVEQQQVQEQRNANGQTREERRQELTDRMNNGDNSIGYREILNIINSEFN